MALSSALYGQTWHPESDAPPAALHLRRQLMSSTAQSRIHFAVLVGALRLLNHHGAAVCYGVHGEIAWAQRRGNRVESGLGLETMPTLVDFGCLTRG